MEPQSNQVFGLPLMIAEENAGVAVASPMQKEILDSYLDDEAKHESPVNSSDSGEQNPTVFVGNISKDAREPDLFELFSPFGRVEMVSIKVSKSNGKSLGYGFVRMSTNAEAILCIEKLSGAILCGRSLRLGWAERNRKLMVRNLPPDVSIDSVNALFYRHSLQKNRTKLSLSGDSAVAILMFSDRDAAEKARNDLHGSLQFRRLLSVEWARYSAKPKVSSQNTGHSVKSIVSVFVQFNSEEDVLVTPESLKTIFERFGDVIDVKIKQVEHIETSCRKRGHAFVHYSCNSDGLLAAMNASEHANNTEIDGIYLYTELSNHCKDYIALFNEEIDASGDSAEAYANSELQSVASISSEAAVAHSYPSQQFQSLETESNSTHISYAFGLGGGVLTGDSSYSTSAMSTDNGMRFIAIPVQMMQYSAAVVTQSLAPTGYYVLNPLDMRGYSVTYPSQVMMDPASTESSHYDQGGTALYHSGQLGHSNTLVPPGYRYQVVNVGSNSPVLVPRNDYHEGVVLAPSLSVPNPSHPHSNYTTRSHPQNNYRGGSVNRGSRRGRRK